jgi:hypothetical protein
MPYMEYSLSLFPRRDRSHDGQALMVSAGSTILRPVTVADVACYDVPIEARLPDLVLKQDRPSQ